MSTKLVGGPRDGFDIRKRWTTAVLWCGQWDVDPIPTMKYRRGDDAPDGATVYHFVEAKYPDGHVLTEAEWRAIPPPGWYAVGRAAVAADPADTTREGCECPPCPGRGNDGHGLTHCPTHGRAALRADSSEAPA